MSDPRVAAGFLHASVEPWAGDPLGVRSLSDRQRLGVIFQAAALLSHLESAGWQLALAWRDFGLDERGVLKGARVEPGSDLEPAQRKLVALVEVLFGAQDRIVGKGQARRLAARMLRRWHRSHHRLPANRIVTQILDEAEFLWQPAFAAGRRALVAEIPSTEGGRLVVAGRAAFERELLSRSPDREALEDLVTEDGVKSLWRTCGWRGFGAVSADSRIGRGRQLHYLGRWQEALDTLAGLRQTSAWLLRADCLRSLGRLTAAKKVLASRSAAKALSAEETLELSEVEAALLLDQGDSQQAMSLLAQRRLDMPSRSAMGLGLLAAEVAARCGEWQAFHRCLPALEEVRNDAQWSWRWHRLRFWGAHSRGDLEGAESHAAQALTRGRRSLPRFQAAMLWRRLASVRVESGDLRGAEKAAGHALRLLEAIDESAAIATSRWLADLRLRQGRLQGIQQLLRSEESTAMARDFVGDPSPEELRARMDLVRGRPSTVLSRLESTLENQSPDDAERWQRRRILAARALGWLGRGAEARELLDGAPQFPRGHLEPEELPALWALAGDWTRARDSAGDDALGRLWRRALRGDPIPQDHWEVLSFVGGYRAARVVFDLQILMPGKVPRLWLEKSVRVLRGVGAHAFAERLDRSKEGTWRALETFLKGGSQRGSDFGDLFATAGYFDARLEWRHQGSVEVLVPGRGGSRELKADRRGGELCLSASSVDSVVRALFALAVREFEPAPPTSCRMSSRVRGILGESEALLTALERLDRLASSDIPVLIQGETGTGKELAVRQLHHLSARSPQPLVTVNCAALSDSLLLSDLFGHVRGAFTGADRDRAGVFESARGGTVLLDEIGDLPLPAQGKLLRVLQEGEVRRVGESLPRQVDIRIVAATHRDLRSMVEERGFRADLFYRLRVGCLTLPPLRNRGRDVLVLADHFVERSGHTLTPRARQRLLGHPWPGNVRELRNVLQVAVALSAGTVIDLPDLELPSHGSRPVHGYHQQVEDFRRELVRAALAASGGQRSAAARRLELSRQALSYLVRRFGLQ